MIKNKITGRIGTQLILAVAISFIISLIIFIVISQYVILFYMANPENINVLYFNISYLLIFFITICVFIITFLLLINKKIKYIKYASEKVKNIASGNLDERIKIKGNDELAELFVNINSMSLELKHKFDVERESENIKNELVSSVSHDLRTPLTSIVGYIDLLRMGNYKNKEQFDNYIEIIYNKSQNLKKLINELFEYTKLSSPKIDLNYNKVDLGSLLEQLIGEYIPIFEKEGMIIKLDIPDKDATVSIDIERIVRVFDNILINAKKYSTKPSNIYVKLNIDNRKVAVSISNETEVMPLDDLNKIFDKFYRIDKARTEDGGSGLGLAIAKKIIELHNGKIWAEYTNRIITINIEIPVEPKIKLKD
ncbi:HAMP domain-containing protein [Clostridium senegalense]|uniref:sensor histidine kinase n=1 Tax=Clostridium senegalense TaxID=1465809 RepID=UPI001C10FE08|nr:ATP-binding protein [Clostridium senegalense]MBU5226265.1 HAMP domain-containing protein [Clostridium senegalense]